MKPKLMQMNRQELKSLLTLALCGFCFFSVSVPGQAEETQFRGRARSSDCMWESEVLLKEGNQLQRNGRFQMALYCYRRGLAIDPGRWEIWPYLGSTLYRLKRYEEALEAYDTYLLEEPDDSFVLFRKALVLYDLGRLGESWQAFRTAGMSGNTQEQVSRLNYLGCLCLAQGRVESGLSYFKQALDLAPADGDVKLNLANAYLKASQPDEARRLLEELLNADPSNAYARNNLGVVLVSSGHPKEAQKQFGKVQEREGCPQAAYNALRHDLNGGGATAEAAALADAYPDEPMAIALFGVRLYREGRYAQAVTELERIKEHFRSCPWAACYLGLALYAQNKPQEALPYLEFWNTAFPDSVLGWQNLAVCWRALGNKEEAERCSAHAKRILNSGS